MQRILVVGGGTAGSTVASRLARELAREIRDGKVEVRLLTEGDDHLYQPGLLYVGLGLSRADLWHRSQRSLLPPGVQLTLGRAAYVDVQLQRVTTEDGQVLPYDELVLATGSLPDMTAVPGLAEGGDTYYTEQRALTLREKLATFEGGRIVTVVGIPHKCPVAPLEFMFLVDSLLRQRGLRDKTELVYTYPLGRAHSLATVSPWAEEEFSRRGIQLETFFNVEEVDPTRKVVRSLEGTEIPYDLLVAVPPHRGARFLKDSGLAQDDGFVPVDRHTLTVEGAPNVTVLGDTTNLPISKAGSTAHYEAEVVAERLVDRVRGHAPTARYDGKVFCFIEAGDGKATYVSFDYDHPPVPAPPSRLLHLFKLSFNRAYWLTPAGIL